MSLIIIPARYASTRLGVKMLKTVNGKPLIQHTYENAQQANLPIIIAVDDVRLERAALAFGADVCLTHTQHISGTSRISEVIEKRSIADDEVIINVQGDEPLLPSVLIKQTADNLHKTNADVATLRQQISNPEQINDPNCVKVVVDYHDYALYFSRALIPNARSKTDLPVFKHIGLYAYRAGFIKKLVKMPASPLEKTEKLEQLSVLWHGFNIHTAEAKAQAGIGIDTIEDLQAFRRMI